MSDSDEDFDVPSSDDEDYIPGADSDEGSDEVKVRRSKRNYSHKSMPKRSCRKKGISLAEESDEDEEYISEAEEELEESEPDEEEEEEVAAQKEETEKKRIDDLWQSFKSETSTIEKNKGTSGKSDDASKAGPTKRKTVKVSQTFDFAGEEVKVTKEVDAELVEAEPVEAQGTVKKQTSTVEVGSDQAPSTASKAPKRRMGGGLGSVLGSLNKKPKLSTLEKSKLDWEEFKEEEGIADELRTKSKSGYLDKQEFLQRADYKQWENEREMRLSTRKLK